MPFLINCTNKGCGKFQAPFLDQENDEVYCSLCQQTIAGITVFAKQQMKSLKQFKPKSKKSFAVKCNNCNKEERPIIVGENLVCTLCKKSLDQLTPTFKTMLKEQLSKLTEEND
jgi:ribosomal protein L34E